MTAFAIRPARAEDLDRLLGLAEDFYAEDGHVLTDDGRRALTGIVAGEPAARAWIFELKGRMIGYGVVTVGFSVEHGGRDGFLDDFYLVPEARGRGLGRRALEFLVEEARKLGIRILHLEVEAGNDRAEGLYRRAGFRESGRRLMSKRLVWPFETGDTSNQASRSGENRAHGQPLRLEACVSATVAALCRTAA
jgi:ribosomal protein S18 acetylase RimI-like enzyme